MNTKTRNVIGWVLTIILSALLIFSGVMKLMANPEMLRNAAYFGLSVKKFKFIGAVEIISALFFLFPRTGVFGAMLIAAYMGGAIATHLEHFLPPNIPVLIECLIFITTAIRFPEMTRRLTGSTVI